MRQRENSKKRTESKSTNETNHKQK